MIMLLQDTQPPYHVLVAEATCARRALVVTVGHYELLRNPVVLTDVPVVLQPMLNETLGSPRYGVPLAYI